MAEKKKQKITLGGCLGGTLGAGALLWIISIFFDFDVNWNKTLPVILATVCILELIKSHNSDDDDDTDNDDTSGAASKDGDDKQKGEST